MMLAWLPPSNARSPVRHLVEDGAEREDIGARVERPALELLGRHVLQRADDRALGGERRAPGGRVSAVDGLLRRPTQLREAEVEQLRAAACVSMMLPASGRDGSRRAGARDPARRQSGSRSRSTSSERQRAPREARRERLAFEVLHHEIVDAVLLADVVERRRCAGDSAPRSCAPRGRTAARSFGVGEYVDRQDLDRDGAIEPRVARLVDLAHAAGADGGDDLVRAESGAWGDGRGHSPRIIA